MRVPNWIGLAAVGIVAFVLVGAGCNRMERRWGTWSVGVLTLATAAMAAWIATPSSRAMAAKVEAALKDVGLSKQAAALTAGMTEAQFSRQLNHVDQLSLSRLADLGPDFETALAVRMLEATGRYTVIQDSRLARIVAAVESIAAGGRSVAA